MPDPTLLCGGAGLRLRCITADAPKSMAPIAGRPFLELLLRQLRRHGFQRAILAVGYRQDMIRSYFGEHAFSLEQGEFHPSALITAPLIYSFSPRVGAMELSAVSNWKQCTAACR